MIVDPRDWTEKFPLQVQSYLYSHLATEFGARTLGKTGLALHELVGVPQLFFILKEHYSLVGGEREDGEDRSKVRAYLLLIIKEFIAKVTKVFFWLILRYCVHVFSAKESIRKIWRVYWIISVLYLM